MNEDELELERRLNDATRCPALSLSKGDGEGCHARDAEGCHARDAEGSQARDAETAALVEGWQALGHLLESANADFRPELVIKQLHWRRVQRRLWHDGALLAATLLIGLGITWYLNRSAFDNKAGALPDGSNMIVVHPAEKPVGGVTKPTNDKPAALVKSPGPSESPSLTLAASATKSVWDQSLDDQISAADDNVRTAETLGSRSDDQIEQLDRQLASFRQEVEASSL
jgi:hypothetical protein